MIGDPFLNYFALFLLFFVVVVIFYAIIAIHDIPHIIAKGRHHPHQDAIHAAGWVSLFTLHAIWPFLWIWAMAYRPDRGWGFSTGPAGGVEQPAALAEELAELRQRIASLEAVALSATKPQAEVPRPSPEPAVKEVPQSTTEARSS
jgi:hypothetical protein